jgi:hypothetical protein
VARAEAGLQPVALRGGPAAGLGLPLAARRLKLWTL